MSQDPSQPAQTTVVRRRRRDEAEAPQEAAPVAEQTPAVSGRASSSAASLDDLLASNPDLLDEAPHAAPAREDPAVAEDVAQEFDQDFQALMMTGSGGAAAHKPGDKVRGVVVSITDTDVYVDIGGKTEATIPRRELVDAGGQLVVSLNQPIDAQVLTVGREGVRLSYGALKAAQLAEHLEDAERNGLPIEGKVVGFNDGGLDVRVGPRRAFCPRSQVDRRLLQDLEPFVGKTLRFLVVEHDPTGRKLVLSRRALLEKEAAELADETRKTLSAGDVVEGVVRKVMPFGAFVDIGGLDGLVHVSELSWDRVEDPSTVVEEGQSVRVKVLRIDDGRGRVALSMKEAQADPWELGVGSVVEGSTATGQVTRLADFGAFVQLTPGVEGLIHLSELDWNRRINHPREVLSEGQEIAVRVLEIDRKRRRIALSYRQALDDPWAGADELLQVGKTITVKVDSVIKDGLLAEVAEGIVGFIPNALMDTARNANHARMFRVGSELEVQIVEVDRKRRRVKLSRKALSESGADDDYRAYRKQVEKPAADGGQSALALALSKALKKN